MKLQDGYTALHVAAQSGKPKVIEALLGQGANVHVSGGTLQQVRFSSIIRHKRDEIGTAAHCRRTHRKNCKSMR